MPSLGRLPRATVVAMPIVVAGLAACNDGGTEPPAVSDDQPPEALYTVWQPRVVSSTGTGTATLNVYSPDPLTAIRLVRPDNAEVDLTRQSTHHWSIDLATSTLVTGYSPDDNHAFVGFLDFYQGETRTLRANTFVNVRNAAVGTVLVSPIEPGVQATPHVLNILFDSLYFHTDRVPHNVMRRFYEIMPDSFDFVAVVTQVESFSNRSYTPVRNDVHGIGSALFDSTASYGSAGRLRGTIHFPIASFFDLGAPETNHEIGHAWINFLTGTPLALGDPHWPISDLANGIMRLNIGGDQGGTFSYTFVPRLDGGYTVLCPGPGTEYNDLELYLMGLLPADSVQQHIVFRDQSRLPSLSCGGTLTDPVDTVTIDDIIAADGPRTGPAPHDFRIATVVLSQGKLLSQEEMEYFDYMAARAEAQIELPYSSGFVSGTTKPFYLATGGRATLRSNVLDRVFEGLAPARR